MSALPVERVDSMGVDTGITIGYIIGRWTKDTPTRSERMTTELIRVPATFYVDHESRDLWTPKAVKRTARHIWIEADDPAIPELLSDAEHYAEPGQFDREYFGLCSSARATMKALQAGPHTADLCAAWDGDGQAR